MPTCGCTSTWACAACDLQAALEVDDYVKQQLTHTAQEANQ